MLLDVDPRGLPGSRIQTIQFQRAEEGNPLDDVIVIGHDEAGNRAILEVQVKRSITFAPTDPIFLKVARQIKEASDTPGFWISNHQLAIGLARTTERIEKSYQDVLAWARNFETSPPFHARLARPGAGNGPMRTFVDTFRKNLADCGGEYDDESVWLLLRRLQILVFDFTASGSASIELMRERAVRALHPSQANRASELWTSLTDLSQQIASNGGEISRATLIEELKKTYHLANQRINFQAIAKLGEDSRLALLDIDDRVLGIRLLREKRVKAVQNALESTRYVEIRGEAGVGKSGVLRHFAEEIQTEAPVLVFSPNRTIPGGWGKFRDSIGYDGSCRELLTELSLSGSAILFIDNLDFFGADAKTTVNDFVRIASSVPGISVIVTARNEYGKSEPNWLPKTELALLGRVESVFISDLDDSEVAELRDGATRLSQLLADSHPARPIARNLFRLSRLVSRDEDRPWPVTEAEMATQWWALADGHEDELLHERLRILHKVADHYLISVEPYDAQSEPAAALISLIKSGTLRELRFDRVAFRHDVLREWAVGNLLAGAPDLIAKMPLIKRAPSDLERGIELAGRMSIEKAEDTEAWLRVLGPVNQSPVHDGWRRAVLLSLVRSEKSVRLIIIAAPVLVAEDALLLRDLIRYVLAVEFESFANRAKARGMDLDGIPPTLRVPRNASPRHLIMGIVALHQYIPAFAVPEVAKLYGAYLMGTLGRDFVAPLILPHVYAWLLLIDAENEANPYGFINRIFEGKLKEQQIKAIERELRSSLVLFCDRSPQLAADYLMSFHGRTRSRETRTSILGFRGKLAEVAPKELVDFTIETLIPPNEPSRNRSGPFPPKAFENSDVSFQPASPAQGPFLELLIACPDEGLRLIRHLVEYEVCFNRGNTEDANAVPILFRENDNMFPWREFYYWPRVHGNASSTVVFALMALEAWAHRRIDDGEPVEAVVSCILAAPSMSCAVLLVATDIVLSHWPESADAGLPLFGSPELLSLDMTRDHHDNVEFPDFFGLKEIQREPIGWASIESLKQRSSRRTNLYKMLTQYTFGPAAANAKLRSLLERAAERLGPPDATSDLGDPRQMVRHALNAINPQNWGDVTLTQPDGNEAPVVVYQEPPDEAQRMEPIREKAWPQISENAFRMEIQSSLASATPCTPEFLDQAIAWAQNYESILDVGPDFDRTGERLATTQTIMTVGLLIARDGTAELVQEYGDWIRTIFTKAFAGDDEPSFLLRTGIAMNPRATAFVGLTLLLQKNRRDADLRLLLHFVMRGAYAAPQGFALALNALSAINTRIVPAILRCGFLAAMKLDYGWRLTDDQKKQRVLDHQATLGAEMNKIAGWLEGSLPEPEWPIFPLRRRGEVAGDGNVPNPSIHVNEQLAAIWLKAAKPHFDPSVHWWPAEIVANYRKWTREENGAGSSDDDRRRSSPDQWNEVYFDVEAHCLTRQGNAELEATLDSLFSGLPEKTLCDCVSDFLLNVDRAYFERKALTAAQAVIVRGDLIKRVQATRIYGWNRNRDEPSMASDLAPAVATICFNDQGFRQTKCYLPVSFIERADVFLPLLETFVRDCSSPYVALMYLNFMEVAPRPEHSSFVATCAGIWLDRFPNSDQFWIEWEVGGRICIILISIFQQAPEAFSDAVMLEVNRLLSKLVSLGAQQAYELEQMIYYGQL